MLTSPIKDNETAKTDKQKQAACNICRAETQAQACFHSIQKHTAFIFKNTNKNHTSGNWRSGNVALRTSNLNTPKHTSTQIHFSK